MNSLLANQKKSKRVITALLVAVLSLALVITMMPQQAFAAADGDTGDSYTNEFQSTSTENSGRVWSDKSVHEGEKYVDGHRYDLAAGENFNVVYSALGSSEKITGKTDTALDVVFILDTSGSMEDETSDGKTRIDAAIDSLNHSLDTLLRDNPNNRVAVTTFATGSGVLMPLANYKTTGKEAWTEVIHHDAIYIPRTNIKLKDAWDETIVHPATSGEFISFDGENVNATWEGGSKSVAFAGGTNTQLGFKTGMEQLVNEQNTSAEINGKTVKRVPIVVMLSDGASTYSVNSKDGNWWSPSGSKQGPGNEPFYGNGMLAMMNAAYNKQAINSHYGVTGTPAEAKVYTIGLGVGDLTGNEKALAQLTLNPTIHWNDRNKSINDSVREKWGEYTQKGNKSIKVQIKDKSTYTANHPSAGDISSLLYEDGYFETSNAAELDKIFEGIVNDIVTSAPDYPTDIKGANAGAGGFVTYTDPIGKYMEVKKIKALIHDGTEYKLAEVDETHYIGEGTIKDPVTGNNVDLSNLTVEIQKTNGGSQTLVAKIPAAAIPLKINEVKLKKDGSVENNVTAVDPSPIRLVYSVGMQQGVDKLDGVSPEYISQNTENGKVNFYSNLFSGNTDKAGKTVGDANTSFTPAADNPNYYFQQNQVVYHDSALTKPVKDTESFDPAKNYYLGTPYYVGTTTQTAIVERTGAAYDVARDNHYLVSEKGNWALKAGTPRNYHIEQDLSEVKMGNTTSTAEMLYAAKVNKAGFTINDITFYHGNNGKVQVEANKDLVIKKNVTTEAGVKAPDRTYRFDIKMAGLTNSKVNAVKTAGGQDTKMAVSFDGTGTASVELKDGESIRLTGVSGHYDVTEQDPGKGFTVTSKDASGQIGVDKDSVAEFTNDYKTTPITVDQTEFGFPMTKTITGRHFEATDKFTFNITGPADAMPEKNEAVIDGNTVKGASVAEVDFGKFTFSKPGTYEYIIKEAYGTKDDIAGITYDSTRYKLIITVKDDGHGNLSILDSKVRRSIDADNWTEVGDKKMSFINEFKANSAAVVLNGSKIMENKTLGEFAKSFEFRIKADDPEAPMPAGLSENGTVQADKTDGSITFGGISLGTADIGNTYTYTVTEIQPTESGEYEDKNALPGAVKDSAGNWTYKGIIFDHSEKKITVKVDKKGENGQAYIVPSVEGNNFEFTNTYHSDGSYSFTDAKDGEPGVKTITGRDFMDGDEFTFEVTSEVSSGTISKGATLPSSVTVSPKTGKEIKFDFGSLKFTEADAGKTFTYTFREKKGSLGGITYDPAVKVVTLKVTDNNDGTLKINRTGDSLVWNNKYHSEWKYEGFELTGLKDLTGKELTPGMFSFSIKGLDGAPLTGGTALNDNTVINTNGMVNPIIMDHERAFYILDHQKYTMEDLGGAPSKTFVYEIRELKPEPQQTGMKYDGSVFHVAVTVKDNMDGTIGAQYSDMTITKLNSATGQYETAETVTFKNDYHPEETSVTPFVEGTSLIKKQLTGPRKDNLKADEFKFKFALKSEDPKGGVKIVNEGTVGNKAPSKNSPNTADVVFENSKLTFTEPGTYVFTVTEETPVSEGVVCKTPEVEITYTVKDVDGKLVAAPSFTGDVTNGVFVNEYSTSGTVAGTESLEVLKELNGREWKNDDSFEFRLEPNNEITKKVIEAGYIVLDNDKVVIDAGTEGHKAAFGDINITYPGTYEFRISESAAGLQPGIHADGADRIITVKAVDNGNGTMTVTSSVKAAAAAPLAEKDNLIFTNTYEPGEATLSGEADLSVRKTLNGRDWIDSDAFTFTLEGGDEATKAVIGKDVILGGDRTKTSITITNKSINQTEHFSDIVFKREGTYKFTVTESKPDAPNVAHDTSVKTIIVDVTLNKDGTLTAARNADSDELTFNNTYTPTPQKLNGKTDLKVTKKIDGRDWLENESYDFELSASDKASAAVLPEAETITIDGKTKTGNFSDLTFTKEGVYKFQVVEKMPEGSVNGSEGLTYDQTVRNITVTVKDNLDGTLTVMKDEKSSDDLSFTNRYEPEPVTYAGDANLKVKKVIDGRDWVKGDRFSFALDYDRGDAATDEGYRKGYFQLPADRSLDIEYKEGTDQNSYIASFGDITFTKAGEYKFSIREFPGNLGGMTYDGDVKNFTVKVTDDGKGRLTATSHDMVVFTNKYKAEPVIFPAEGSGDLQVTKVFKGREWKDSDEFSFTLEPIGTYPAGSFELGATECTVKGTDINKVASFGDIKFFKTSPANGYQFLVREKAPASKKDGITYDTSVKRVSIEVTDDNRGHLHAKIMDRRTDPLIFTNTYKPGDLVIIPTQDPKGDGTIGIKLSKALNGREWKDGDSFSFRIEPLDGAPATTKSECTVTAPDQMFDFGILRITSEDMKGATEKTFRYKVTEIIPETKIPGVEYSADPIVFSVKATDNGKGFLIAGDGTADSGLIKNDADGSNAGEFVNVYTPAQTELDGAADLKVVKDFTGRPQDKWMDSDEFTFQLTVSDPETNAAKKAGDVILPENASGIKISAKDDPKENAFGNIIFKKAGTYKFDIGEVNQNIAGVTYAKPQHVTVIVTDDSNGKLVAKVKEGTELTPFTNEYRTGTATLSGKDHLNVEKKIEGREWKNGDSFTFTIAPNNEKTEKAVADKKIIMPENNEVTITIDDKTAGHMKHFGDIVFNNIDDYEFKVTENLPEGVTAGPDGKAVVDGMTYDTTPQIVKVKVSDVGDGTLKASTDTTKLVFVNRYETEPVTLDGKTKLSITKKFDGVYQWQDTDRFEFYMTANNAAAKKVALPENIVIDGNSENNGRTYHNHFADMTFSEPGVYEFFIHEKKGDIPGVSYDTTPRKITVTVTDNLDGTLKVVSEPEDFTFTNRFDPAPAELSGLENLKVHKILMGRPWNPGDSFKFTMTPDRATAALNTATHTAFEMPANAEGIYLSYDPALDGGAGNGQIVKHHGNFGNIKFNEKGIYTFDIVEEKGSLTNIKYDQTKHTMTIYVAENRDTGKLEVSNVSVNTTNETGPYDSTSYYEENGRSLEFINSYTPDPAYLDGSANLRIEKELLGRDWKDGDEFTFRIEHENIYQRGDIELPEPNEITIRYDENGDHTGHFGDMKCMKDGTYRFKISEIKGDNPVPGVSYAGYKIITVKVTDDHHGKLHAEVVGDTISKFTNAYDAEDAVLDGKANLQVEKIFEGRGDWKTGDSFKFKLAPKTTATANAVKKGIVKMGRDTVTVDPSKHEGTFGDITFTREGSYVFEVEEIIPSDAPAYVDYDRTKKTIFVEVTDDQNGHLVAALSDTDVKSVFTNKYTPEPAVLDGKTNLELTKALEGREWKHGDTFLFEMKAFDDATQAAITAGDIEVPSNFDEISITEETKDRKAAFGDIRFSKPGTYTFRVAEKKSTIKAVKYDEVGRVVTVVVKDDDKGTLSIDKVAVKADESYKGTDKDNLSFTNTYSSTPAVLDGSKNLKVEKTLKGRNWKSGDSFSFSLAADTTDNTTMNAVEQGWIVLPDNAGRITITDADAPAYTKSFGDIKFKKAGDYRFSITETNAPSSDKKGITYDTSVKTINAHVVDNLDGTMSATADNGVFEFVNTYNPDKAILEGKTNLKVEKLFKGKEWKAEGFTFKLAPVKDYGNDVINGTQELTMNIEDVTHTGVIADGVNIVSKAEKSFGDITFSKKGTYSFYITEVKGNTPGISYNTKDLKARIDVEVSDDDNGKLTATVLGSSDSAVFRNEYMPEPVIVGPDGRIDLEIGKELTGRDLTDNDKWTFNIRAAGDNASKTPMPEKSEVNNSGSSISFGNITYKEPGEYSYVITESGKVAGVTNDADKIYVNVKIGYDQGRGDLVPEITYTKGENGTANEDGEKFVNSYHADPVVLPGKTSLNVEKILNDRPGNKWTEYDKYEFHLGLDKTDQFTADNSDSVEFAENGTIVKVDRNDHKGSFGDITFKKPGTYFLKMTEKDTNVPGVQYDSDVKIIKVTVTDNLDGTLSVRTDGDEKGYRFINSYEPGSATLNGAENLSIAKVFKGRNWGENDSYRFRLTPTGDTADSMYVRNGEQTITMKMDDIIENGVTGKDTDVTTRAEKAFGDIVFGHSGTYTFQISEVNGDQTGIAYSDVKYDITVKVTDDPSEGKLKAAATWSPAGEMVFTNVYTPDPVEVGGKDPEPGTDPTDPKDPQDPDVPDQEKTNCYLPLMAHKTLDGRVMTDNDQWTFTIEGEKGAPMPENTEVKNAKGLVKFGNIEFTKAGTYRYTITESGSIGGVTNDNEALTAEVIVTYDADLGKLSADINYSKKGQTGDGYKQFSNTYKADPAEVSGETYLKVKKTLSGREWKDGDEFSFSIAPAADYGNDISMGETKAVITDATKDHTASFGNITVKKEGTYRFNITEKIPEGASGDTLNGITYDRTVKTVEIVVKDNQKGSLEIVNQPQTAAYEFVNTYDTEDAVLNGAANLDITKIFKGKKWTGEQFGFTIEPSGDTAGNENVVMPEKKITVTSAGAEVSGEGTDVQNKVSKAFGNITFKAAGKYTFTISEIIPEDKGNIEYDAHKVNITVNVEDKEKNGKLTAAVTKADGDKTFTNVYKPDPIDVGGKDPKDPEDPGDPDTPDENDGNAYLPLMTYKTLTGRDMTADDKWTFTIEGLEGAPEPAEKSVQNDENGFVKFGSIKFSSTGTFKYRITETGTVDGVANDDEVLEVTVKVGYDEENGKFIPHVTYSKGDQNSVYKKFQNTYKADPLTVKGETYLQVMKTLSGREWKDSDEFTFTIAPAADYGNDISMGADEAVITKATKDHTAAFGNIVIKKAGTYKFNITEKIPAAAENGKYKGITYDGHTETVTLKVKDNLAGKLVIENDPKTTAYEYVNTYGTDNAVLSGKANLEITKVFKGKKWTDEEFTFTLKATGKTAGSDKVIMPAADTVKFTSADAKTEGEDTAIVNTASKAFGDIQFTQSGEYTFSIEENIPADKGNTAYDSHKVDITVIVTDNEKEGHLTATAAQVTEGSMTFTNTYTPDPVDIGGKDPGTDPDDPDTPDVNDQNAYLPLLAMKDLDGRQMTAEDKWTFTLTGLENAPMPASAEAENDMGIVKFGNIKFDKTGTYRYEIAETGGDIPGVVNDNGRITAEVKITYDEEAGRFIPHVTYTRDGQEGTFKHFTNEYKAGAVAVPASVFGNMKKNVEATDGNSYTMKGGEFTFELSPASTVEGDPVKAPVTAVNDRNGKVSFLEGKMYVQSGTYVYNVKEISGSVPGIGYDEAIYTITVKVTDNVKAGKLEAVATVEKDGAAYDGNITFSNSYDPEAATAVINGTKNLEAVHGERDIRSGDFSFALKAKGDAPLPEKTTVDNVDGAFAFDAIEFTKPGEYKYTVSEVNKGQTGFTYDKSVYNVTITVSDEAGVLKAVTKINGSENGNIVFDNQYAPVPAVLDGDTALRAGKELTGRDLNGGEFKFEVSEDGNVLKTVSNDKNGNIVFSGIKIAEPGTHNFIIAEKSGNLGGVTYDHSTVTAAVEVIDDNGTLKVESIVYSRDGEEVEAPVFTNEYAAAGTGSMQIGAVKTLKGGSLEAGQFEFQLKGEGIDEIVKNDASGAINFSKVEFSEAGTYNFTVTEKKGSDRSITYDDSVYDIEMIVTDNLKGAFETEVNMTKNGKAVDSISFVNTKDASDHGAKTGDDSNMNIFLMMMLMAATGLGIFGIRRKLS